MKNVWLKVGKALLFMVLWLMMSLGMDIMLLIFSGVILFPFTDIVHSGLDPMILIIITLPVAVVAGGYCTAMLLYSRSHWDDDKWVNLIANAMTWMMLTTFIGLMFNIVIMTLLQLPASADISHAVSENRYYFLAAVVLAGSIAWFHTYTKNQDSGGSCDI